MIEKTRCRVRIQGRVQGVAYRWEALREAERLGVEGWMRNRSDGSVEGVFEGDRGSVEALIAWCRSGPALAGVTSLEVENQSYRGEFQDFQIRR